MSFGGTLIGTTEATGGSDVDGRTAPLQLPMFSDPDANNDGLVERLIDVPADAVNATTGTGENLGWFGEVDRALDPRNPDEWAETTEETTGLTGLIRGATGAGGAAAEDVTSAAGETLLGENWQLWAGLIIAVGLYVATQTNPVEVSA